MWMRVRADLPGLNCDDCTEAYAEDGILPACASGKCLLPQLTENVSRILKLRHHLMACGDLVGKSYISSLYRVTIDDLDLLAVYQEELKRIYPDG